MRKIALALALILGLANGAIAQAPPAIPALPDSARLTQYSISGTTCACSVGFAIYGSGSDVDEWIQVYVNGVAKLSTDATFGWSLSSVTGPLASIPRPITNAVLTFNSVQTATVQIVGAERPRRLSQFPENRGVAARDLNQAVTDQVAVSREAWDKLNRAVVGQPGEVLLPLPNAAARAGLNLVFDVNGNPSVTTSSPGSLITSNNNWTGTNNFSGGITAPELVTCTPAANVGFFNDGSTDNLALWNTWVTSLGSNSACLQFSAGTYKFTGQAAATLAARQTIQIRGSGQDVTEVWFSAGNGFNFTMNTGTPIGFINSSSVTIADMAVTTSAAGGVNGITINGATSNGYIPRQTNISRVALRGHVTTAWWAINIALTDLSDIIISQVGIYGLNNTNTNGTGISYIGTGAGTTPTLINVNDLIEFFLNVGISASGSWQGLNVSKANIVDVTTGISCTATSLQPECNVFLSQFNTARHGIVYSNIQTSSIIGNLFYQGTYTGLVNGDAIISQTTGSGNVIASNVFSAFTLGGATPNCIDISGGGSPVNTSSLIGNTFAGCTTNIVAGTSANTMAAANINANGTPFTGGGSFFAYMGTSVLSFPGASMTLGGGLVASGAVTGAGVAASADPGGTAAENTLSNANSSTISTGVGSVKMSTANAATNTSWIKAYCGTAVCWIPAWVTNAP